MQERKGFTKREKRLLLLMAVVGFSALMIVYVILPFFNRLQDENDRYSELTFEQMQMQMLFMRAPVIHNEHADALQQLEAARERFLNEAHISEIGRMLTALCEAHNLNVINQQLASPVVPEEFDAFLVMPVTMTLNGMYDDLNRLLDTVYNIEYLRITRVSFNMNRTEEDLWGRYLERVSVSFEVIMMQV